MSNKQLSICIPTYNRFKNLEETLQNISSTSKNISFLKEILILDNNENSKAKDIIEKHISYNSKIKYVQNEKNIGPEKNFKRCIELASADYVWMVADDDLLFKDSLNLIESKNFDFDILIVNWSLYNNNFSSLIKEKVLNNHKNTFNNKNEILSTFGSKLSFISSIIFKKKLFDEKINNFYDTFIPYQLSFLALVYSIIDESSKVVFLEKPLIMQRGDNDPFLGNNIKNFYNVFSDGIHFFHKQVSQLGYSDSAVKRSFKNSFYYLILRDLINRKVNKDNYELAFSSSYKNYSHILSLKLILLLIYIIPANLFLFFKTMKKVLK